MPAAPVTITAIPNANIVFTGTWSNIAGNAANYSGSYQTSNTTGDTVTLTFTGTALYAFMVIEQNIPGKFTVTVDGVLQPGYYTNEGYVGTNCFRSLVTLARGLSAGAHTVILTIIAGTTIRFDAMIVVNAPTQSAKGSPSPGSLVCVGDSVTNGTGPFNAESIFPNVIARQLQEITRQPINMTNQGVSGTALHCVNASVGGAGQIVQNVPALQPQYLTIEYGINDLSGGIRSSVSEFLRHYESILCFIEDAFDVTQTRVAICTPPYVAPYVQYGQLMSAGAAFTGVSTGGIDMYETAVQGINNFAIRFPWLRIAHVYEAMDRRVDLIFPNNAPVAGLGTDGVHPNDNGAAVIGWEFAVALLGLNPYGSAQLNVGGGNVR